MSGSVNLTPLAALTYGGGNLAIPYGAPFGTCSTTTCHTNGKGTAVVSSSWGTSIAEPSCAICHLNPNTAVQTGNEGARHVKHDGHVWAPNICGTCHAAPNNKTSMGGYATHINGVVNMGGTATVAYLGAGDCTNTCHDVIPAAAGDWLDAAVLACADCHTGTFMGAVPTSGLHGPMTNVMAHDVQFKLTPAESLPGTATCTHCHTAAGPSNTHLTGPNLATPQTSVQTTYSWVSPTYIASYAQATGCQATCHTDYKSANAGGLWRRKWMSVTDTVPGASNNPGDAVCGNCHGDWTSGWRWDEANTTTTDHTNPYAGNDPTDGMSNHSACQTCHGWGSAGYNAAWGGPAPGHGDGSITMNGPDATHGTAAGAEYNATVRGCENAGCHGVGVAFTNSSAWPLNYGNYGGGSCENCHSNTALRGRNGLGDWAPIIMGNGTSATGSAGSTIKPYDDGTWGYNVNGHGANGTRTPQIDIDFSASFNALDPNLACTACHALLSHHNDGVLDGGAAGGAGTHYLNTYHLRTDLTYPYIKAADPDTAAVQITFDDACYRNCHQSLGMARGVHGSNPTTGAVQFGRIGNIISDGEPLTWPVDSDITTRAGTGGTDWAPCSTCHNAHGTSVVEPALTSNRMLRLKFKSANDLCNVCHF